MTHLIHIVIGVIAAVFIWKLIKVTFKSIFWIILFGIIAMLVFPKALVFIGGLGFLFVGFLVTLIVLGIAGLFFFERDEF
ncbi:hypothetical protein O9H85_31400 [Paenibacillus filicis]|uniref:Uncharacterized protein n=1 Tax=Paenibacillus gyeongsangnamensis TaxID=3388067 RepID=A0ABT4QIW4_9BACL|nr:hypothetical protein [Paenibacillus filicis]MCZ8516793.1 hypothetical protein [Paenibacillus filicis]